MLQRIVIGAIRFYQRGISPLTPPSCRYHPTCSAYALEAIERYGAAPGGWLALAAPPALPPLPQGRLRPGALSRRRRRRRWSGVNGHARRTHRSGHGRACWTKRGQQSMEKRLILAVLLMSAVILLTNLLFPAPKPAGGARAGRTAPRPWQARAAAAPPAASAAAAAAVPAAAAAGARARRTRSSSPRALYRFAFSTRGAALLRRGAAGVPLLHDEGTRCSWCREGAADFLSHRLVVGADTVDLRSLAFQPSARSLTVDEADRRAQRSPSRYARPGRLRRGAHLHLPPRRATWWGCRGGSPGSAGRPATLLTELGPGLAPHEALRPPQRAAARGGQPRSPRRRGAARRLRKVEGPRGRRRRALTWAGIKDKYFLAAMIAGEETPLSAAVVATSPTASCTYPEDDKSRSTLPRAELTAVLPVGADGDLRLPDVPGPAGVRPARGGRATIWRTSPSTPTAGWSRSSAPSPRRSSGCSRRCTTRLGSPTAGCSSSSGC